MSGIGRFDPLGAFITRVFLQRAPVKGQQPVLGQLAAAGPRPGSRRGVSTSKRPARSAARARSCEVITTVRPRAATWRSTSSSIAQASWSSPVWGSSSSSTSGSCSTARPIARRCCIPREKVRTRSRRRGVRPTISSTSPMRAFYPVDAVHAPVKRAGFPQRSGRRKAGAGAKPPPAGAALPRPGGAGCSPPPDTSPRVGLESEDRMRRKVVFPAPFGPSRATNSPCFHLEIQVAQHHLGAKALY